MKSKRRESDVFNFGCYGAFFPPWVFCYTYLHYDLVFSHLSLSRFRVQFRIGFVYLTLPVNFFSCLVDPELCYPPSCHLCTVYITVIILLWVLENVAESQCSSRTFRTFLLSSSCFAFDRMAFIRIVAGIL